MSQLAAWYLFYKSVSALPSASLELYLTHVFVLFFL